MGCCGEDDGDLLLAPFFPDLVGRSKFPMISPPSSFSSAVLSPSNSNISTLVSRDVLRSILELLPPPDLGRAACVCRIWREVASHREVLEHSFRSPWGVRRVLGDPSSPAFWRHPGIDRFAISHRLLPGDTITGLALKYAVQATDIRRLNNMMSDHGIYSRERLLIPISKLELLLKSICYIERDENAKREVAVLYLDDAPGQNDGVLYKPASIRGKRRILNSMKRHMQADDGTAEYYFSVTNGDLRAAFLQFSEDLRWEQQRVT